MYNSQNLPCNATYPVKQESKPIKVMADYMTYPELLALNRQLAEQDRIEYLRAKHNAEIAQLDGLWAEILAS